MKSRLVLCAMALALSGSWSSAQAQVKMVFHAVDGTRFETSLDQVRTLKITPQGFDVNGQENQVLTAYKFKDLKKICFESLETSINQVVEETQKLKVCVAHQTLKVLNWPAGTPATASIYAATGQCVYRNAQWTGEDISLSGMPLGVYILKVNQQTYKFVQR